MRVLLVEDDKRLRERLRDHFRESDWVVEEAADGREANYHAAECSADIAIVDLGLPDVSGIDLIRRWREDGLTLPILILTARADWQDKVGGLEAGADDYVTKPFYLEEVEARVHALLRRVEGRRSAVADFGALKIDFNARRVLRDGEELALTSFEYNTLACLARRPGEVVSRAELMEQLYDHDHDRDSNVLEVFVGRLRRKLDGDGTLTPIETVRGAGYRFTLDRINA